MLSAPRIFEDLRQFLRPDGGFSEKQASRWISELVRSEYHSVPFIEITDDFISLEILNLWKQLKRKIDDESTKQKLDQLLEKWARRIFMKTKKSTQSHSLVSLFDTIHSDLNQFVDAKNRELSLLLDGEDSTVTEAVVLTWIQLLFENLVNEKTMRIPDQCLADDSMLNVWMKLKERFWDEETKNVIEKIWLHYVDLLSEKTRKEKTNRNINLDPPAYTQQISEDRLFLSPAKISTYPGSVVSTPASNLTSLPSVSDVSMPSVSDCSMRTPASVSSDVSVFTPASIPSVGPAQGRVFNILVVDKLNNPVDVFKYQKTSNHRGFCVTGECGSSGQRRKEGGVTLETLCAHARQKHSMRVNLKRKTGKKCEPLRCPFCNTDCNRKQILREHLKKKHEHFQLDDETVNKIVAIVDDDKLVPAFLHPDILSLIETGLNLEPNTAASSFGEQSQAMRAWTTTISRVHSPVTNNQSSQLNPSYSPYSSAYQADQPQPGYYDSAGMFSPQDLMVMGLLAHPFAD